MLEAEVDRMNDLIRDLRVVIEQEREKVQISTIQNRKQADEIESLKQTIAERDNLIGEFRNKLSLQVNENESLNEENKRLMADNMALKQRIEELRPLEQLNLDRETIQPRLDYVKEQEEILKQR